MASDGPCDQVIGEDWPVAPKARQVVLHTRVVTRTGGGPDKTILLSAAHMVNTSYWLAAAYMHPPKDPGFAQVQRRAVDAGCPLISVPDRGPLDYSVFRRMLDVCRHYEVRVWHGHDYKSNMLGLMIRPFWKMKLVSTVHGWVKRTARTPLYYAIDRWCLPYYHHVICVSEDLCQQVRLLGVPEEKLSLVHNAIDQSQFKRRCSPAEAPLRDRMDVPEGRLVMGAMGRLSPEKAFGDLILAAADLIQQGMDVELWIGGEGEGRDDLQRLIDRVGAGSRVKLIGFVSDPIDFYHALDLFVLPSRREGLPNVVLEAMSMRVPVVATGVAGLTALIRDGENGLLCRPGDIKQIASACRRVLADERLRRRLAEAGRSLIETRYALARRMDRVRAIYDRVLGLDQGSPGVGTDNVAEAPGHRSA